MIQQLCYLFKLMFSFFGVVTQQCSHTFQTYDARYLEINMLISFYFSWFSVTVRPAPKCLDITINGCCNLSYSYTSGLSLYSCLWTLKHSLKIQFANTNSNKLKIWFTLGKYYCLTTQHPCKQTFPILQICYKSLFHPKYTLPPLSLLQYDRNSYTNEYWLKTIILLQQLTTATV